MSEFDSILRVALRDDSIFDAFVREAQRQGCSIRALVVNAVLGRKEQNVSTSGTSTCERNLGPSRPIDAESYQRICDAQMREAIEDPRAHAKNLGELAVYPELWEVTPEEARSLWDS